MTVTPSTSDVADKAVSTDDGGSGMEVARLEAVLAALVETKVEAMKASSTLSRRSGSAPASPRRPRLTSTSTASSSLNHHHHHHHHHQHPHSQPSQQQQHKKKDQPHQQHHRHRRRRYDSAPCGEYLNNVTDHSQHKSSNEKERRRVSESPRSPRKKHKHSRGLNLLQGAQDVPAGLDPRFESPDIDGGQDVVLIDLERAKSEYPSLHRSAYFPASAAQLKIRYDDDDYVALDIDDELDEEEMESGLEKSRMNVPQGRYHRPRRKRKRKRRKADSIGPDEELDPEELPQRARWTIVATACLLLAMSLLLVGVTLRMAPIIDDMDDHSRRPSASSSERIILYVDDFATATGQDLSPEFYNRPENVYALFVEPDNARVGHRSSLYPPSPDFQLDDRSSFYPLNSSERSPCSNPLCSQRSTPRRSRSNLEVDQRSSRRSSVQSSRSRANSCSRPTPLGDDRRASVCKKTRPRRASTTPRRDSARPTKTDVKQARKIMEDARELEQARRHRRIAMIVLITFIFLLTASVLVVVITLTHSTFLSPVTGSKELAEHGAQLRKENEELLNSLNRDISVPENVTAPP